MEEQELVKPIFSVKNVTMDFKVAKKSFFSKKSTIRALNDISFDLYPGESLAIVGESGCGKSTLCRIAMKFYEPSSGKMFFEKENIHELKGEKFKNYRQKAQMIFQDPFSSLNPLHNIYYHLKRPLELYHPSDEETMYKKMDEYLTMVGLTPPKDQGEKFPHQLSGGQKQRAYIARVLAVGADVIFADEPTSMLDVSIRLGVLNLLNKLKKEMKKSFVYITHDIATARYFADRIIVLYAGHMVEWGDVDKVICNPKHPYTRLLVAAAPDPEREGVIDLPVIRDKDTEIRQWTPESKGCPFRTRCPEAKEICASECPEAREVEPGQFIRCIHG
ncbi:ATP-binding cassette domain-containing protein [Clostridium sp. DSM 100503]|uniref:ABC transporter ATP-binding protein n=1 Tax=Clostridium sp. DSM 100503 TaxID=2963282 RepID=UPI00214A26C6|nr:oligopeptide/dipeptide ABC transporter ATP-binding protein [Clostridium sp. DSM 100503]MCR1951231.1 ATP-binding cassette domain-containing protein [Clostridium sp. DSM 100503]